jgi:hypothetical protein
LPRKRGDIPVTTGSGQEYSVVAGTTFPATPFNGVTIKNSPEQISAVCVPIVIVGPTVTISVKVAPVHVTD